MKQVLAQLAASRRRQTRATGTAQATSARAVRSHAKASSRLDCSSLCLRATLLLARWQRSSQGRIGLNMGCVCAGEAAIDMTALDGMILDHLLRRFAHKPRLASLLGPALAQADLDLAQGRRALSELLQTLAQPHHGLPPQQWSELLDALQTSIASIEEHRGIA